MLSVHTFAFNPFSENTYLVSDEHGNCIVFDPGMYDAKDQMVFSDYILEKRLKPQYLINTHCHIDHIMGNTWVSETFGLELHAHKNETRVLEMGKMSASLYGLKYQESVPIKHFLDEKDVLILGEHRLEILFTPGHSPGSLSFYSPESGFALVGDVLFRGSIGRTDLPGGDFNTLMHSISTQLLNLPDSTRIYNGHGPSTDIGTERLHNPFINGQYA